jgi:hypothetical protein
MPTVNNTGPGFDVKPWTHGNCHDVFVLKGRYETTSSYIARAD